MRIEALLQPAGDVARDARRSPRTEGFALRLGGPLHDERAAVLFAARAERGELGVRALAEDERAPRADVRDPVTAERLGLTAGRERGACDMRIARGKRDEVLPRGVAHLRERAAPHQLAPQALDGRAGAREADCERRVTRRITG